MAPFLTGFLSTPSARRATRYNRWTKRLHNHFYPRPPRGGRRDRHSKFKSITRFLSTPSARRATSAEAAANRAWQISIHALGEAILSSAPRAVEGSPPPGVTKKTDFIHALRERGSRKLQQTKDFYPRPPRGASCHRGRPICGRIRNQKRHVTISIHALCEEGDSALL